MENEIQPPAKFERFEKILVTGINGAVYRGTILWRDCCHHYQAGPDFKGPDRSWWEWYYEVSVPDRDCCCTFVESQLQGSGQIDSEEAHLGKRFEISFDTVLLDDMTIVEGKYLQRYPMGESWEPIEAFGIVEGSYRIPDQHWQVFTFSKKDIAEARHEFGAWESGNPGINFEVPEGVVLYRDYIIRCISKVFGTEPESWILVRGPDSVYLK